MKLKVVLFALAMPLFVANQAAAALIFDFQEIGGNVELTVSGSIDLNATLGFFQVSGNPIQSIDPAGGTVAVGDAVLHDVYLISSPWVSFGSGSFSFPTATSGARVIFYSIPWAIGVPLGYVSGSPLSATGLFAGATFASLGMTPGSYTTVFSNGNFSDSVTVNVGQLAPVPEPASLLLLGSGLAAAGLRRRMKKRS